MINFSLKKARWGFRSTFTANVAQSYHANFTKALLNLEINLHEEKFSQSIKPHLAHCQA